MPRTASLDAAALSPAVAEVNLAHLRHNARRLAERAAPARLLAVVKADAYGHGALRVVRALQAEGVHRFAVARVGEAVALREAGVRDPLLLFEAPFPAHLPAYVNYDLEVTVSSPAVAEAVMDAARTGGGPLRAHVKVETGLNRIGMPPEEAVRVLRQLREAPGVELAGVWTHLAAADDPAGAAFTRQQVQRLRPVVEALGAEAFAAEASIGVHVANSAALLAAEGLPPLPVAPTLARAGIALYGAGPTETLAARAGLRPVMRLTARVTHVKTVSPGETVSYGRAWKARHPTRLATLGIGYADGYPRRLSGRADVSIRGRRFPIAGAICMDMLMVDLGRPGPETPGAAVRVGDEAVLFGEGGPSLFTLARHAETIPYELCCAVAPRVPRRYLAG